MLIAFTMSTTLLEHMMAHMLFAFWGTYDSGLNNWYTMAVNDLVMTVRFCNRTIHNAFAQIPSAIATFYNAVP